ncbi:MAG: hypothetical protein WDA16_04200 [Candidatus Thermoplasmatota archaeon]
MTISKSAGNGRVRLPEDIRAFAALVAAAMNPFEAKHGNHRAFPAGHALRLLLASHGYLPKPTSKEDIDRMNELRRIADAKQEARQ